MTTTRKKEFLTIFIDKYRRFMLSDGTRINAEKWIKLELKRLNTNKDRFITYSIVKKEYNTNGKKNIKFAIKMSKHKDYYNYPEQ